MNTTSRSGAYPIENVDASELERLRLQHEAWASDTTVLLDEIGVGAGWKCLDLGCGPFGLTRVLADAVGPTGDVIGLEYNDAFVAEARSGAPAHVKIVQGDAYDTSLPGGSFDLVHMRFLASVAGDADRLLAEAIRLVRPGGVLACQEATTETIRSVPSDPAFDRLTQALVSLFPDLLVKTPTAHHIYTILHDAGFENVGHRTATVSVRSGEPWHDYIPSCILSARSTLVERGIFTDAELDEAVADCRAFLSQPGSLFVSPQLVQVWGRKPG
ncbi:hypothetical protein AB833_24980 [Chromatiales bacterium (ex Bugula neritina AB1)]|nr:hypothetical protein AB833_24980 [Chromatiales bacterium (ex Bugula neritina AB1)]